MNEDLLMLSSVIDTLEDECYIISVLITELAEEFEPNEKVSIQDLIKKIDEKYPLLKTM